MPRNRSSAKQAGARFETLIAKYLNEHVDDRIERRQKNGALDRGDIASVRTREGERVVIECKEYGGRLQLSEWIKEVEVEVGNDNALFGVIAAKRRGTNDPGKQWIVCEVDDFVAMLTGRRPGDE